MCVCVCKRPHYSQRLFYSVATKEPTKGNKIPCLFTLTTLQLCQCEIWLKLRNSDGVYISLV